MNRRLSPLPLRLGTAVLGALLLAPLAAGPVRAADPAQAATAQSETLDRRPPGTREQLQTLNSLRDVGTAMFLWYREQAERHQIQPAGNSATEPKQVDVSAVPVISAQELEKILVPLYIGCIPEKDGWGRPIEYRLNTRDLSARQIMGIRSAGADGRFAGSAYEIGGFQASQADQDLVWVDGYFARWPQGPPPEGSAGR